MYYYWYGTVKLYSLAFRYKDWGLISCLRPSDPKCSVVFNYLGRDFFNALSEKNPEAFQTQLFW